MTAQELRLGNLVIVNHKTDLISKVISIQSDFIGVEYNRQPDLSNGVITPAKQLIPIPLTEEWLQKLGFNKHRTEGRYGYRYYITENDWGIVVERDFNEELSHFLMEEYHDACNEEDNYKPFSIAYDFKWVHQLQNAYFSLTGKELEVKP